MTDPATSTRLADFLPYLLSVTSNAVSSRVAEVYRARFGLRIAEWRVMAVLGDAGALTQRDLTAATLMDKVAVNRACKELEDRGLAARTANERDGRSHHLELTADGRAMYGRIMPLAVEMERQLFDAFSPEERQTFRRLLERLRAAAGDLDPDQT
ncbi:MarR family winged helix-turn-helix transcriptional regulator [Tsuneonella troitsensis]|jgi:DNA-binding MarR family transcriptional regulator|uniref:MarR family winged helix-turn-helix transcriptional regulator n=1 Tax=Tsuneonella troitsensis TaxID=292222 RepID=UPI00071053AF|nr:MarR family winged helix-turn-helix transcriptional regulator [Tsuneonella troitsensis]OGS60022.1 MAG: MarR family transcriptional regulator [Erythrobacter sp. RIFCSPHIGHO2_12_FULL_63_10]